MVRKTGWKMRRKTVRKIPRTLDFGEGIPLYDLLGNPFSTHSSAPHTPASKPS